MERVQKYFDFSSYSGLFLLLPATIIITAIQIGIGFLDSFKGEYRIIWTSYIPKCFIAVLVFSSLSILICFEDIIRKNLQRTHAETKFVRTKRFFNLAIIAANLIYCAFVYLFIELSKFSIPVGQG